MQYRVWCASLGQTLDTAALMYVNGDARAAAEEWARTRDAQRNQEIANGQLFDVSVWDGQRETKWSVRGELRPVYFAISAMPAPAKDL